jgi:tetratricopeptide (TPR) repeat protein
MSNHTEKPTRSSSADYPVDPAERSSQEARLKKAAAAGASATKSPISALRLQPSPSLPAPKKLAEPQTTSPQPVTSTESASGTSGGASALQITNDEVLAELRKISAWADLQRKLTKWSLLFLAALVPILIGGFMLMDRQLKPSLDSNLSPHQADWYEVERNVRVGDFDKAIAIGEELILKMPQYPEAHERLARAYLACGNLDKAKEHYAEAFRLFPSEENEKLLRAIENRVKADKP